MSSKYTQGLFVPQNPQKIVGNKRIQYRSSWELRVMSFLDSHPNVLEWGSECLQIPYQNPLTGKHTVYVPDFLIKYSDASGKTRVELVEVKPKKETFMEAAKSKRDKAYVLLNTAKWQAASIWCAKHGVVFRILNEDDIFVTQKAKKK
jgi:hypothetical protein